MPWERGISNFIWAESQSMHLNAYNTLEKMVSVPPFEHVVTKNHPVLLYCIYCPGLALCQSVHLILVPFLLYKPTTLSYPRICTLFSLKWTISQTGSIVPVVATVDRQCFCCSAVWELQKSINTGSSHSQQGHAFPATSSIVVHRIGKFTNSHTSLPRN